MSQIENSFKNSLRNFQSSTRNNGISLPLSNNAGGSSSTGGSNIFKNFRESASNTFSNVSNTVQGYIPIGNNVEEEEPPFYQLSRVERVMAFGLCLALGIGCFTLSFFFIPMFPIFPGKFAATFTLGSILILVSIALLRGPWSHLKHMISMERLPFTVSYVGSMILTLYASIGLRSGIITMIAAIIQVVALLWYVGSYIPGGIPTLRYGFSYIGSRAVSILPI